MTVASIIDQYNIERPNSVEDSLKVEWLRKCEANLIDSVILLRKIEEGDRTKEEWQEYLDTYDLDTEMILKEPYDDLYLYYLDQRISLNNNDKVRYNVAARLYDNAYLSYQQKYNREHLPIQHDKKIIRHEDI